MGNKGKKYLILLMLILFGFLEISNADTISFSDSIPMTNTDWVSTVSIPMFDPSLGTLNSITFDLTADIGGTAGFENKDLSAATITMNMAELVTLQRPDSSNIVTSVPIIGTSDNVTAYDGITDYSGTSGNLYTDLYESKDATYTSFAANDLLLFTGVGNIDLTVNAMGITSSAGAANISTIFIPQASANALITYDYVATAQTPEPTTISLLAVGLAFLRKKRNRKSSR